MAFDDNVDRDGGGKGRRRGTDYDCAQLLETVQRLLGAWMMTPAAYENASSGLTRQVRENRDKLKRYCMDDLVRL